jgi:hypothetical protein
MVARPQTLEFRELPDSLILSPSLRGNSPQLPLILVLRLLIRSSTQGHLSPPLQYHLAYVYDFSLQILHAKSNAECREGSLSFFFL